MPQSVEFLMPYPSKFAANLAPALERHIVWARKQGLIPTDTAEDVYRFCQHAEVGAWFCPDPDTDWDLDLQLDINGWYFVFDDAFDTPKDQAANGAAAVCQELMELVSQSRPAPKSILSPLVSAFADVWQRECEGMSPFWRQRAAVTWAGYLAGNLVEEANRRIRQALRPADYLNVRCRSVGVLPDFDMYECMGRYEVPPLAWYSSHMEAMRASTVEHVILVNDVCSLEKDEARGDVNIVTLLTQQNGCSRSAAIAEVTAMADSRMRRFQSLEAGIPRLCEQLTLTGRDRTAVDRHVKAMIDMLSGNYHWSRTCGRYSAAAAAQLNPDQPGLLAGHDLTGG
jgi:pentalenene synthase